MNLKLMLENIRGIRGMNFAIPVMIFLALV